MSGMEMQNNGSSSSSGIYNGAGVTADGTESGVNNPQGRSVVNAGEAGWARRGSAHASGASAPLYTAGTCSPAQSRESVAMHSMGSGSSWRQASGYSSPAPQAVAARMVDPSVHTPSDDLGSGGPWTISRNSLASVSEDYSLRHGSHYGSGRQDTSALRHSPLPQHYKHSQSYLQQQQQQPTLAALALADSRGQLDSGLGYYYQQPPRVRVDFRGGQHGISSEPASVAGSPVCSGSSSSARIPSGRTAGSVDNAVFGQAGAMSPAASALGVMFPSSAAATTTITKTDETAGQRSSGSSRRASRDSSLRPTDGGARSLGTQREAVASGSSEGSDSIAHGRAQSGATHAQLSALSECGENNRGRRRQQQHHQQRHQPGSAEFTPQPSLPSTPSVSAASLTAASSSFSFGNQRIHAHHQSSYSTSSQPAQQQQQQSQLNALAGSNTHRHSTAASTNRDSMFLRFKEKMRHFKPRSRPQSDHIIDRRLASSASQGLGPSAPRSGQPGSPLFKNGAKGNSSPDAESQLFGMSLEYAVKVAGMRVGQLGSTGEACVVPTVVAVCGRHLWVHGQQMQGIFRVNGSMKRVQRLQAMFNTPPEYGRNAEWSGYTLHDAATMLRRYLTLLPASVISPDHYSAFMDKLAEAQPDDIKARDYGLLIEQLVPESRHTLLYMLELLSIFALPENSARTLMNSSNLAAVLQPCLLVHPGHLANPQEYSRAKDVIEFLIVHASIIYPNDVTDEGASERAGLVVFDSVAAADGQSLDGERCKLVASDDGTAVDPAGCTEARGTPQYQQNRWSSTFTRVGGLTAAHSADSMPAALQQQQKAMALPSQSGSNTVGAMADGVTYSMSGESLVPGPRLHNVSSRTSLVNQPRQQQQRNVSGASMVPPRGDSLVTMSMVISKPAMTTSAANPACAQQVQSLGSVTARLFDPTSPTHADAVRNDNIESSDAVVPKSQHFVGPYNDGQGHHPSAALNSIQYEHTKATNRSMDIRSPPATRPRRSMSFVVTSPVQADDAEFGHENLHDNSNRRAAGVIDEFTQDMISRSTNAVHARRGTVERRAGHVNVQPTGMPYSVEDVRSSWRPLPQIPQRSDSVLPSPLAASVELPRSASECANQLTAESKLRRVGALASSTTDPTGAGFQLYPRTHAIQPSNVIARTKASTSPRTPEQQPKQSGHMDSSIIAGGAHVPQDNQEALEKYGSHAGSRSGVPHSMQTWTELPGNSSSACAHWLSEDAPEDEYEFVGGKSLKQNGKAPATRVSDRDLRLGAQMAAVAVASSGPIQLQGLPESQHPNQFRIAHLDTMAGNQGNSSTLVKPATAVTSRHLGMSAGHFTKHKAQRAVVSADSSKDKVSMTRLKNIFRMGHSSSSSSGNVGGSGKSAGKFYEHSSVSSASHEGEAGGGTSRFPVHISSPRLHPKGFQQQQQHGAVRGYRSPSYSADNRVHDLLADNTHETANRIQVAVPAGHLSIVYPDSPMSKTDTLRRSSAESYIKRMSIGPATGSGHAYLVNPDAPDGDDETDLGKSAGGYPSAYHGADLHVAPSNTTTLRSSTLLQSHQHQPPSNQRSQFYEGKGQDANGRLGQRVPQQGYLPRTGVHMPYATVGSSMAPVPMGSALGGDSTGYMSSSTTFQTTRGPAGKGNNVGEYDNGSSGMRRMYAMERLADSDTQIDRRRLGEAYTSDGADDGGHGDTFVLPSISNGSPLLTGFEFGSPEMSGHSRQSRVHGLSRELYPHPQSAQSNTPAAPSDQGTNDNDLAGSNVELSTSNTPRRSRSLRNTITSLRRKMSRSSRNGTAGGSDATPASMEEAVQTASVH
ncbi:GTPase activating protein (GAP) for Rho1p [Coemansia sp. RSA 988]|nr:GTPase activating protein (GAP) for Rho1p [Coemansia sp. RSA 988]